MTKGFLQLFVKRFFKKNVKLYVKTTSKISLFEIWDYYFKGYKRAEFFRQYLRKFKKSIDIHLRVWFIIIT